jgi:hypothetical protein
MNPMKQSPQLTIPLVVGDNSFPNREYCSHVSTTVQL